MPGFWETFGSLGQQALGDYDRLRQEKRQRALQKIKFLTENMDVGSEVDPSAVEDIRRHADEGAGLIGEDNTYLGTPQQQREHAWRQSVADTKDPMELLMSGTAAGTVSGNSLTNYINGIEARKSREQLTREQIQSREDIANERNQTSLALREMINAARQSGGGSRTNPEDYEMGTRADTQKWSAARKMFDNNPLGYIKTNVLGNPDTAQEELRKLHAQLTSDGAMPNWEPDIKSPDAWDAYARYHEQPDVMQGEIAERGMTPQEYRQLVEYLRKASATARKRLNAGTRQ